MARHFKKGIPLRPLSHSLPIRCTAQQDESGMGFLLRSATANGLSLHGLRDLAGLSSVRTFWRSDARHFARVLDMPEAELQDLLVDKGKYMGQPSCRLREQPFFRTELLRLRKPQICVDCIHRSGYCKAMWDCRLYTVCHLHRKPMVERCKACRAPLRWYRPAVDVCQCGAYFRALSEGDWEEDSPEVAVATWIAEHCAEQGRDWCDDPSFPSWMDALSLDGLCTLIQAMGVPVTSNQRVVNSSLAGEPVEFWQAVCGRAVERLRTLARSSDPTALAPTTWEGALEGWALAAVSRADQQVAQKLLRDIFRTEIVARFGSQRAALCQMRLFED